MAWTPTPICTSRPRWIGLAGCWASRSSRPPRPGTRGCRIPADAAAAGLIISHGHFLHRHAFRRTITAGTSISTGQPLAAISWDAALHALDSGLLPCASSEQAILRIAASLGDPAIPVCLRAVLGNPAPAPSPWSPRRSPPPTAKSRSFPGGGLARDSAAAPPCWPSIDLPAAPGTLSSLLTS
ncbi:MAG TPA: hypothetical protein VFV73_36195 [Streptosporangiaceae bacterium]|nr:hypothetical protein [Streptosporangiaceae bacterium]